MENKINYKISKALISAFCVVSFALIAVCFSLSIAFADYPSGSIKIDSEQNNVEFNAYQIFYANISADESVTYVEWTNNEDIKNIVVAYITELGCSNPDNASEACSFIKDKIGNDARIQGTNIAKKDSFAATLANKIVNNSPAIAPDANFNANTSTTLSQGYWLFVSDDSSIADGKNGSSPIWMSVREGTKELQEKTDGISFAKHIINSSFTDNLDEAFAQQEITFEISSTLPSNFESFPHYYMKFEDSLPDGLVFSDSNAISIYDNDENITPEPGNSQIVITVSGGNLSVEFNDLVLSSRTFTKDSIIKIEYKTKLSGTEDVVYGGTGNVNAAKLTYTNNPVSLTNTQAVSASDKAAVYTYNLNLFLRDGNLEKGEVALKDAQFVIKDNNSGKYVQSDGSLAESEFVFQTSNLGKFSVSNIKTGVYTIKQTKTPDSYVDPENDIKLTIEPTYESLALTELSSKIEGGYTPPIIGDWFTNKVDSDADNGSISLSIANKHATYLLPTTGIFGIAIPIAIGIVLIVVCGMGIYRYHKKSSK